MRIYETSEVSNIEATMSPFSCATLATQLKGDTIGSYLAVAIVYLAMVYLLDAALHWMERASRIPGFDMEGKKA